jgi:hypothetical protein
MVSGGRRGAALSGHSDVLSLNWVVWLSSKYESVLRMRREEGCFDLEAKSAIALAVSSNLDFVPIGWNVGEIDRQGDKMLDVVILVLRSHAIIEGVESDCVRLDRAITAELRGGEGRDNWLWLFDHIPFTDLPINNFDLMPATIVRPVRSLAPMLNLDEDRMDECAIVLTRDAWVDSHLAQVCRCVGHSLGQCTSRNSSLIIGRLHDLYLRESVLGLLAEVWVGTKASDKEDRGRFDDAEVNLVLDEADDLRNDRYEDLDEIMPAHSLSATSDPSRSVVEKSIDWNDLKTRC